MYHITRTWNSHQFAYWDLIRDLNLDILQKRLALDCFNCADIYCTSSHIGKSSWWNAHLSSAKYRESTELDLVRTFTRNTKLFSSASFDTPHVGWPAWPKNADHCRDCTSSSRIKLKCLELGSYKPSQSGNISEIFEYCPRYPVVSSLSVQGFQTLPMRLQCTYCSSRKRLR